MSKPYIRTTKDFREVCNLKTRAGRAEYKARTVEMYDRQHCRCAICDRVFPLGNMTFDHQFGRGSGGGHRDDRTVIDGLWNNACLCSFCNIEKGSKRYAWSSDGKYVRCL
jgi:hypothetical protein